MKKILTRENDLAAAAKAFEDGIEAIFADETVIHKADAVEQRAEFFAHLCNAAFQSVPEAFAKRVTDIAESALEKAKRQKKPINSPAEPEPDEDETVEPGAADCSNGSRRFVGMKKGDDTMATRQDAYEAMSSIAKAARRPHETFAKAYARCMDTDPLMQKVYAESKALQKAAPPPVVKRRNRGAEILHDIGELQKADPNLRRDQAMTKIYRQLKA